MELKITSFSIEDLTYYTWRDCMKSERTRTGFTLGFMRRPSLNVLQLINWEVLEFLGEGGRVTITRLCGA